MKGTKEQVYLSLLSKRLNKLMELLQKKKPGSGYSTAETLAFSSFPTNENVKGLLACVQSPQRDTWLIQSAPKASHKSALYYFQLKLTIISRLIKILSGVEREEIMVVEKELKRINLEMLKRSSLPYCKDKTFHSMVWMLRSKIEERNDHLWNEKMDKGVKMYISVLKYFAIHQKDLRNTKEVYDFLCVSRYMLYGEKFHLLTLLRRVKK